MISSSILNEDIKDILLDEEQNIVNDLLNHFENKNINKNINGVNENEINFDKSNNIINGYTSTISNSSTSKSNSLERSPNNSCQGSVHKKNILININLFSEDDEKSLIFQSEEKNNEKEKEKIIIKPMNNIKIYDFLNSINEKENNNLYMNMNIKVKVNKEQVAQKFEEIIDEVNYDEENEDSELNVMNYYLRKNACCKLYKAFSFLFKKYKIKETKIKKLCKYIEYKAREKDYNMGSEYKQYIINFLKNISEYS